MKNIHIFIFFLLTPILNAGNVFVTRMLATQAMLSGETPKPLFFVLMFFLSLPGLPLLEAKNDRGEKPIDLAENKEIKEFLRTMELQFREKNNKVTALRPSEESYQAVLGRKGRHSTNHVHAEKCEKYLLILSHLVQAYYRMTRARAGFASDDCLWMNFDEHCNNLEAHVSRIVAGSHLSSLACIRIQAMRMLAASS